MLWLLVLAWLVAAAIAAFPLARIVLKDENRLAVLLPFALLAGHAGQSLLLLAAWSFVPLGQSLWIVLFVSSTGGVAWLLLRHRRRPATVTTWGCTRTDTTASLLAIALAGVLAHRTFTVGYASWDAEALYWHSGLVGWLTKGVFPPTSHLEPDGVLHYRFGLHAIAASISANTTDPPPEVLAAVIGGIFPMLALALFGASIRVYGSPRVGLVAFLLSFLGGSLMPAYRFAQFVTGTLPPDWRAADFVGGYLLTGNTLDIIHKNVSLAAGTVALVSALWLVWECLGRQRATGVSAAVAAVALASLAITSEVHFVPFVAAVSALATLHALRMKSELPEKVRELVWLPFLAISLGVLGASSRGGLLNGISLFGEGSDSLRMVLTPHLGYVVTPPGSVAAGWVSALSLDTSFDTSFMLIGLPCLLAIVWVQQKDFALYVATTGLFCLLAWLLVYPERSPMDAYRFGQVAMTMYLLLLPFVAAGATTRIGRQTRQLWRWLGGVALFTLTAPHLLLAASLLAMPPAPVLLNQSSPEHQAARYLATQSTRRILVPIAPSDDPWSTLYFAREPSHSIRVLLGLSRHSIPMGFHAAYFNPRAYVSRYNNASVRLDRGSLSDLAIDWVYVVPVTLDEATKQKVDVAVSTGILSLENSFGAPGSDTERWLFRVTDPSW